jgi:hypothetical protein
MKICEVNYVFLNKLLMKKLNFLRNVKKKEKLVKYVNQIKKFILLI